MGNRHRDGLAESPAPEARTTKECFMATQKSSAPHAHPSTEDQDQVGRPHACDDGWVTIGQMVVDPETGEETEEFALYLCRRCSGDESR
jgi:hypothetical protein